jgi:hypothetical protein
MNEIEIESAIYEIDRKTAEFDNIQQTLALEQDIKSGSNLTPQEYHNKYPAALPNEITGLIKLIRAQY